jgi:hypothetical protein
MRKRRVFAAAVLLGLALAIVLALPYCYFVIPGWVNGEAFFRGQPTSYWAAALKKDSLVREDDASGTLLQGGQAALGVLAEMLQNQDHDTRKKALFILAESAADESSCIPALTAYMRTATDLSLFHGALRIIQRTDERAARQALIDVLRSASELQTRLYAAYGTAVFSSLDENLEDALQASLDYPALPLRIVAAEILVRNRRRNDPRLVDVYLDSIQSKQRTLSEYPGLPSMPAYNGRVLKDQRRVIAGLLRILEEADTATRVAAAEALGGHQLNIGDVPAIVKAFEDNGPEVRRALLQPLSALSGFGPAAKAAAPALRRLIAELDAQDPLLPVAMSSLAGIVPDETTINLYRKLFKKVDAESQAGAIGLLSNMPALSSLAMPLYVDGLGEQSSSVTRAAANALAKLGPKAKPALVSVLRALDTEKEANARHSVYEALGAMGPVAREALPALTLELKNEKPIERIWAIAAILSIEPNSVLVVPAIDVLLSPNFTYDWLPERAPILKRNERVPYNGEDRPKLVLVLALAKLGESAKVALPALARTLKDKDRSLRVQAALALWAIDHQASANVVALMDVLQTGNDKAVPEACDALGQIGPAAGQAILELEHSLADKTPETRLAAAAALWHVDPKNALPGRTLSDGLKDKDPEVRTLAAEMVRWKLGLRARTLQSVLQESLRNETDAGVARAYEHALDAIRGEDTSPSPTPIPPPNSRRR